MRSRPIVRRAGARVAETPASSAVSTAQDATRASTSIGFSSPRARSGGTAAAATPTSQAARASPTSPARAEMTTDSVSSWRHSRGRLAPAAARIANSGVRDRARDRNRFAALAHAISSTQATAPNSRNSAFRRCCTQPKRASMPSPASWFSDLSRVVTPEDAHAGFHWGANAAARSSACSNETSCARRARTDTKGERPGTGPPRPASKGSQNMVSASGNRNDVGITPTMVSRRPPRRSGRPTMSASPPKRVCQAVWLTMATALPASSGAKTLPSSGATPRSGSRPGDISAPCRVSGSSPPVKMPSTRPYVSTRSNSIVSSRQFSTIATGCTGPPPDGSKRFRSTSRCGSANGTAFSSRLSTMANTVVVMATPRPKTRTTATVNRGDRRRMRTP